MKFRCHLYGHWTAKWAHHRPARGFSFLVSEFYFTILHKPNIFVPVNTKCGLAPGRRRGCKNRKLSNNYPAATRLGLNVEHGLNFPFHLFLILVGEPSLLLTLTITIQYNKPSPHYNARQQFRAQSRVMIIIIITI